MPFCCCRFQDRDTGLSLDGQGIGRLILQPTCLVNEPTGQSQLVKDGSVDEVTEIRDSDNLLCLLIGIDEAELAILAAC